MNIIQIKVMETKRKYFVAGQSINKFINSMANSDTHEMFKLKVFRILRRQGFNVMTEAEFLYGKLRADVVNLDCKVVIEIKCSESDESIAIKRKSYPEDFKFVVIDTKKPFREEMVL